MRVRHKSIIRVSTVNPFCGKDCQAKSQDDESSDLYGLIFSNSNFSDMWRDTLDGCDWSKELDALFLYELEAFHEVEISSLVSTRSRSL